MCMQTQGGGFARRVIEEMQRLVRVMPDVGEISVNRMLPPKMECPEEPVVVDAIGSTVSRIRKGYNVLESDDFLEEKMTPQAIAQMIVKITMELSEQLDMLKPALRSERLGETRVYFLLLNAVLALFLDKLAGKVSTPEFDENIKRVQELVSFIAAGEVSQTLQ